MSHRSLILTTFTLLMGLGLIAAAGAQTSMPAPSTQASPATQQPSAAPPSSSAQSGTASQGAPAQGGSTSVEDELQLTQDQKQKIAVVVDDENKQIAAVRDDNSLSMQQKQQKVMQIRQEGTPKIKAVLTPEQLQKLAAIQQRARAAQSAPQSQSAPQGQTAAPQPATPQR